MFIEVIVTGIKQQVKVQCSYFLIDHIHGKGKDGKH